MNLQELKQDVYFLTNSTSASYPDDDLLRNLNRHYDRVATLIWEVAGDWTYDDTNYTTLPIAVRDLVSGQSEYSLPTTARTIERVEVKNADGDWVLLKPITKKEIKQGLESYLDTAGLPQKYNLIGNSIFIYPPPDADQVTLTEGIRLYVSRSVVPLSASEDEPGFASEFHRILSLGAAQDFCIANQIRGKEDSILREKIRLEEELKSYYAQRHKARDIRFVPTRESYK